MGAGAGLMGKIGPEAVEKMKDVSDEDIKKAADKLPKEMIAVFKRVVEAAEAANPPLKKRDPVNKLGNSDKADKMDSCLCFWDEAKAKGHVQKGVDAGVISGMPDELNGAIMAVSQVAWKAPKDATAWDSKFLPGVRKVFRGHGYGRGSL